MRSSPSSCACSRVGREFANSRSRDSELDRRARAAIGPSWGIETIGTQAMRVLLPILLLPVLLAAGPADAGKLFECRDRDGRISFVDHGCPERSQAREIASTAAAERKAGAEPDAEAIAAWAAASKARMARSLGGAASVPRTPSRPSERRSEAPDDCSRARDAQRKAERERSFALGFDERRRLSDAVLMACGLR
jgi:hypothetical protein